MSENFEVYTVTEVNEDRSLYTEWYKGLEMYIRKEENGVQVSLKLNSEEIQQIVKTLPRTLGGVY